jgi:hypothetical protein
MEHQLAVFIGAFALLLSILFGSQATIHLAIKFLPSSIGALSFTSVPASTLFDQYQQQIIMNTFAFTILPTATTQLIHRPTPSKNPSAHSFSQPCHVPTTGTTIFNNDQLPSFQLPPAQVRILQNAVSTAPQWSYPHSP